MSSTFGDKTDVIWYKTHNLAYKPIIGLDGELKHEAGPLRVCVHSAREKILELLKEAGFIKLLELLLIQSTFMSGAKKRSSTLFLTMVLSAFLPYKQQLIDACFTQIEWYPAFMKSRYINWVEHISWDWCLSRQRFYGIPFPAWHCTSCNKILLA